MEGAEMAGWRVNDVVAFDTMQERLTALNARLLAHIRSTEDPEVEGVLRAEMLHWRQRYLEIDGTDRDRINELTDMIDERHQQLSPGER